MKKSILLIIAAGVIAAGTGTGLYARGGDKQTRTVEIQGSYNAINVAGNQNVFFEIGPEGEPITVMGKQKNLDNLEITVERDVLFIRYKKGFKVMGDAVQIYVRNPTLKNGTMSGTGTLNISGKLDPGNNDFKVSGTGRINIREIDCTNLFAEVSGTGRVECPDVKARSVNAGVSGTGRVSLAGIVATEVTARTSGTGNINLSGECQSADFKTSGTGSVHAENLKAARVKAHTSGTGSVHCHVTEDLDARASGTGKVHYRGEPARINYHGNSKKVVKK